MVPHLSFLETRVLGVLAEKERTVPDVYPMTLNALVAGCNQKTSRDPVINATETEVQAALDHLRAMMLVIESSGGRVARYSHNIERVLQIPKQATALLTVLMLRGPETAGELRIIAERLHAFSDIELVETFLRELAERAAGALATELSRQPGARENRWMHLLSGAASAQEAAVSAPAPAVEATGGAISEIAAMKASIVELQKDVAELRARLERLDARREMRD